MLKGIPQKKWLMEVLVTTKKGIEKPTIHCYLALTLITKFGISFTEIARGVFRPLKDVYLNRHIAK